MEVLRIPVRTINNENLTNEHMEYIESVNNCLFCGANLKFNFQTDFSTLEVKEEAICPACQIKLKIESHILQ